MLVIRNIRVRSLTPHNLQVAWEIEPTSEDPLDYDFRILRSEAQEGPYVYITESFSDKYLFLDNMVDIETRASRRWYYEIEVTHRAFGREETHGPVARIAEPDVIAMEIQRQHNLVYRKVCGRKSWLFPARTFGQRCSSCWDPVEKRTTTSRCLECYGTGFVRGYHNPVEIFSQFDPTPSTALADFARQETMKGQTAHTGSYPEVKPGDMIVEAENTRWVVRVVGGPERARARLRQDMVLDQLPLGDVGFEVPVDFALLMEETFLDPFHFQPRKTLGEGIV